MNIYAIYDKKAKVWTSAMFLATDAHALRTFQQNVRNDSQENLLHHYADDFSLHRIGSFDERTGAITPDKDQTLIIEASTAIKAQRQATA